MMNEQKNIVWQIGEEIARGEALRPKTSQQRRKFSELIREHADPVLEEIWEEEFARWKTEQNNSLKNRKHNVG